MELGLRTNRHDDGVSVRIHPVKKRLINVDFPAPLLPRIVMLYCAVGDGEQGRVPEHSIIAKLFVLVLLSSSPCQHSRLASLISVRYTGIVLDSLDSFGLELASLETQEESIMSKGADSYESKV